MPWKREFDIQEAIDSLPDGGAGQGMVFLKHKVYQPSDTLTIDDRKNTMLQGSGSMNTEIQSTEELDGKPVLHISGSTGWSDSIDNVVKNLRFTGNVNFSTHGIKVSDSYKTLLRDLRIEDMDKAIELVSVHEWTEATIIEDVQIRNPLTGLKFTRTTGTGSFALTKIDHLMINLQRNNSRRIHVQIGRASCRERVFE